VGGADGAAYGFDDLRDTGIAERLEGGLAASSSHDAGKPISWATHLGESRARRFPRVLLSPWGGGPAGFSPRRLTLAIHAAEPGSIAPRRPPSLADGVGHAFVSTTSARLASLGRRICPPRVRFHATIPPFQSRADAVGQLATGVGDDPDPVPAVGSASVTSTHHERPSGVACLVQIVKDPVSALSSEARHVLNEAPSGSHTSHQPGELRPESGPISVKPSAQSRDGDVLAGESSGDEVDSAVVLELARGDGADISKPRDIWKVALEHRQAELRALDLPGALESCALEAEVDAADPREEATESHDNPSARVFTARPARR
jgi:hypothetical protein